MKGLVSAATLLLALLCFLLPFFTFSAQAPGGGPRVPLARLTGLQLMLGAENKTILTCTYQDFDRVMTNPAATQTAAAARERGLWPDLRTMVAGGCRMMNRVVARRGGFGGDLRAVVAACLIASGILLTLLRGRDGGSAGIFFGLAGIVVLTLLFFFLSPEWLATHMGLAPANHYQNLPVAVHVGAGFILAWACLVASMGVGLWRVLTSPGSAPTQAYSASTATIQAWALGGVAYYWMSGVIFSFVSVVFVSSYEMNAGWVALAMMLPRLIDMIIDPMLGRLSDNLHTPWGRRRPFIFATVVLGAGLVVGIWWVPLPWIEKPLFSFPYPALAHWAWVWRSADVTWGFAYLLTFTTTLYANLGAFDMSHTALGYELSDDYGHRSRIQALRSLYFSIGSLGGGFTYWLAQRSYFGHGHLGEVNGFRHLSMIMGGLILVFGLIPVFACRERFQNINRKQHIPIGRALKETLKNRAFVVVLISRVINTLGAALFGALSFYVAVYSVFGGDKEWYNLLIAGGNSIAGFILGYALVPLAAPVTRWLGKRRGLIICAVVGLINAIALPFYMRAGQPYLYFGVGLLFMPISALAGNLGASIMPDICDVDELAHGERREGLFTGVMSFITKLENSICTGIGGFVLVASGFEPKLLQQPQAVLDRMRLYAFTPMIIGAVLTLIVSCFFPLTKKKMTVVRAALDIRHAAAKVPVAAAAG